MSTNRESQGFSASAPGSGIPTGAIRMVAIVFVACALLAGFGIFQWYFCRIEVDPDRLVILIAKTGRNLPPGEILAPDETFKGIQRHVLPEGRYFRNPFFWDWKVIPVTNIRENQVGVLVRRFGKSMPMEDAAAGRVLAKDDEKGIVPSVLMPGRHNINLYEYDVELRDAITIPAGSVGIRTNMTGAHPAKPNQFLVGPGEKGVQRDPVPPGVYYLNPYEAEIRVMSVRSNRLEIQEDEPLLYPSADGFPVSVHLAVEWAVDAARAPEVFVRVGELSDNPADNEVLQKILLPAVRGLGRIEGSKFTAVDYISGKTRLQFQTGFQEKLKAYCDSHGVLVKAVLINRISPAEEIVKPIQDREIAKEELGRNKNQLQEAIARQSLMRQTTLVDLERSKVGAETAQAQALIASKNRQEIALIEQGKLLSVARQDLESAKKQADAVRARGGAEAEVIRMKAVAEAEALKRAVAAYPSPADFAAFEFAKRLGPKIESVFASPDSPFGRLFEAGGKAALPSPPAREAKP
ncbi:MAG: SPFH domain-containing protein [Planctomycetota bacterium]